MTSPSRTASACSTRCAVISAATRSRMGAVHRVSAVAARSGSTGHRGSPASLLCAASQAARSRRSRVYRQAPRPLGHCVRAARGQPVRICTPGIVLRLAALEAAGPSRQSTRRDVEAALRAHLCRCTGWQSIVEAACSVLGADDGPPLAGDPQNQVLAGWRAQIEGSAFQRTGPDVVTGGGGFADDTAPRAALVQLGADAPLAPDLRGARTRTGRVQGRNSTVPLSHPVDVPEGQWALTLRTTWVEPAYVEPDASWCRPGRAPASPLGNGGAFGGKSESPVSAAAREQADASGAPSGCCGDARTSYAADPNGRPWRWRSAPTARASCGWDAPIPPYGWTR